MVPTLQLDVNPVRHRQNLAQGTQLRSRSQRWRHEMPDDLRVKGISREAHPGVPDDTSRGFFRSNSIPSSRGADVNQREVAGAPAEIPNEDEFVVIERGFVIVRGGDGLHLKLHGFVTSRGEGRSQPTLRIGVIFRLICAYKMNRPSDNGRPD